jgi:hypothetical protein
MAGGAGIRHAPGGTSACSQRRLLSRQRGLRCPLRRQAPRQLTIQRPRHAPLIPKPPCNTWPVCETSKATPTEMHRIAKFESFTGQNPPFST